MTAAKLLDFWGRSCGDDAWWLAGLHVQPPCVLLRACHCHTMAPQCHGRVQRSKGKACACMEHHAASVALMLLCGRCGSCSASAVNRMKNLCLLEQVLSKPAMLSRQGGHPGSTAEPESSTAVRWPSRCRDQNILMALQRHTRLLPLACAGVFGEAKSIAMHLHSAVWLLPIVERWVQALQAYTPCPVPCADQI